MASVERSQGLNEQPQFKKHELLPLQKESPYKAYFPGQKLGITIFSLQPDGMVSSVGKQIIVEDLRGGGFFGVVLIPKDEPFVVKTSLPNPKHHFWREVNWGFRPLPAQVDERSAQLECLAGRLIHAALPILSQGKFRSPNSLGYTRLQTGYAQVVERMYGRGHRFDVSEGHYDDFLQAQSELVEIGTRLGLEQIAQIHPDNPFGMANLWFDKEAKSWIWLDTIPAIAHTGWVWPFFQFNFHKEVADRFYNRMFYPNAVSFNRVHTGFFLNEITEKRHLFPDKTYNELVTNLILYENLWQEREQQMRKEKANVGPALRALGEFFKDTSLDVGRLTFEALKLPVNIFDPEFRKQIILKGVESGKREGLLAEEEYQEAQEAVYEDQSSEGNLRKRAVLGSLFVYYFLTSRAFDALTLALFYEAFGSRDWKIGALGASFGLVAPGVFRRITTPLIGRFTNIDLSTAARVAILPLGGAYFALPAQVSVDAQNKTPLLWHYAVRSHVAKFSKISLLGGWGTKFEADLYRVFGKRIEELGRKNR